MVSILLVSHSQPLALAVKEIAEQMLGGGTGQISVAAGLQEGTELGTDAAAIAAALMEMESDSVEPQEYLLLVDLGSAIISAQMALEFVDEDLAARCQISSAPLVEGAVAAAALAASGQTLAQVAAEARRALEPKVQLIGDVCVSTGKGSNPEEPDGGKPDNREGETSKLPILKSSAWKRQFVVADEAGLHARPAAQIAQLTGQSGLIVSAQILGSGCEEVADAGSMLQLTTLGVVSGQALVLQVTGREDGSQVTEEEVEAYFAAVDQLLS